MELRPNCEWRDKDLPPDAEEALICSYECAYCADGLHDVLHNVCPTCGGRFVPCPIRPKGALRAGLTLGLGYQPASTTRVHSRWIAEVVAEHAARSKEVPPTDR